MYGYCCEDEKALLQHEDGEWEIKMHHCHISPPRICVTLAPRLHGLLYFAPFETGYAPGGVERPF